MDNQTTGPRQGQVERIHPQNCCRLQRDLWKGQFYILTYSDSNTSQWLLFVTDKEAPGAWREICLAVSENRLGIGVKIATAPAEGQNTRVICVYTQDFRDQEDISRVVRELKSIGLVPTETRKQLWYKCDAFTHLDIMSGNPWGLRASLYSSDDFLKKKVNEKKQTSLVDLLNGNAMSLD
jgi:hypothetical protein